MIRSVLLWMLISGAPTLYSGEAEEWISQLAAESFAERESAEKALWELGNSALPALKMAEFHPDPEIRRRVKRLLPLVDAGIRPDWPGDLRSEALQHLSTDHPDTADFLEALLNERGKEAFRYLLYKVKTHDSATASGLLEKQLEDPGSVKVLLQLVPEKPKSERMSALKLRLSLKTGDLNVLLEALNSEGLGEKERRSAVKEGLAGLKSLFEEKKYPELAATARRFSDAVKEDARFLYYWGIGLHETGEKETAAEVFKRALSVSPGEESAHYKAGDLLQDLGWTDLSILEWKKILEVPPADEVYDSNAYLRLGQLYAMQNHYALAAEGYRNGLRIYREKKKRGEGMGMMGADEEQLEKLIRDLMRKAKAVDLGENPFVHTLGMEIKEMTGKELQEIRNSIGQVLDLSVQPHGLRLLEKTNGSLRYDAEEKKVILLVNGKPFGGGFDFEFRGDKNRILLRMLDMRYVMDLDPAGGEAVMVRKFEVDYLFKLEVNERVRALKDLQVLLNGEETTLDALSEGIPMDYLPEKIGFKLRGINEDNTTVNVEMNLDPREKAPRIF